MSTGIDDQNGPHYLTLTIQGWVDVFTRQLYRDIIIDSLRYCINEKGLQLYGYVIMSNHIHLIARAKEGFRLSDIIRDFKKFTSKKIIEEMYGLAESRRDWMLEYFRKAGKPTDSEHSIWQPGSSPFYLYTGQMMEQKINYIHDNPVRANLVEEAHEYMYSSARNYADMDNLLEVEIM